jgi:hypothetical protein
MTTKRHPRGNEVEAFMQRDAAWFKAHPDRQHYVRFSTPVERFDLKNAGGEWPTGGVVMTVVRQLEPGVRLRAFVWYDEPPPCDPTLFLDEAFARTVFERHGGGPA